MTEVKVFYGSVFSGLAGREQEVLTLDKPTLAGLIEEVAREHGPRFKEALLDPATGQVMPGLTVLVNGTPQPLEAKLASGDEVAFLQALAGG